MNYKNDMNYIIFNSNVMDILCKPVVKTTNKYNPFLWFTSYYKIIRIKNYNNKLCEFLLLFSSNVIGIL